MIIDEFQKIDLRIAKILQAERVVGSEKLMKLHVDVGTAGSGGLGTRQILAGIAKAYDPQTLVGKLVVVVANLDPRIMMGLESNGMLLAASDADGNPVILQPEKDVAPGARIK